MFKWSEQMNKIQKKKKKKFPRQFQITFEQKKGQFVLLLFPMDPEYLKNLNIGPWEVAAKRRLI